MACCVSIIIPVCDRGQILEKTLDAVFRQTLRDIEVIVVDDGSDDNTGKVVKEYQSAHPNLLLCATEHPGPGGAKTAGLERARGEYVAFLAPGDWVPETAYEKMYRAAQEREADIVVGEYLEKDGEGQWLPLPQLQALRQRFGEGNCAENGAVVIAAQDPNCWNKMFRKSLLEAHKISFPSAQMAEDILFTTSAFEHAKGVCLLDEVVCMRQAHESGADSAASPEVIDSGLAVMKDLGLRFHERGMVEEQESILESSLRSVLERFCRMPEGREKARVFESIKDYVSLYRGLSEYQPTLRYLFGMDLDTMLALPYYTYEKCKERIPAAPAFVVEAEGDEQPAGWAVDPKEVVLNLFREGQIGLRYVWKYFVAWLKFKLRGKPS